jgi:hypothetical protein
MSTKVLTRLGYILCLLQTSISDLNLPPSHFLNLPPTHFVNVHAVQKGNGVEIEWTNPAEEDVAIYEVERSGNGRNFRIIGMKLPSANNGRPATYTFLDSVPLHGPGFYRIAARQQSGITMYSQIITVSPRDMHSGFDVYPNPVVGNQFSLVFSDMTPGNYTLELISFEGRGVFRQQLNIQGSTQSDLIVLPPTVAPGMYALRIRSDQFDKTQPLIIR